MSDGCAVLQQPAGLFFANQPVLEHKKYFICPPWSLTHHMFSYFAVQEQDPASLHPALSRRGRRKKKLRRRV